MAPRSIIRTLSRTAIAIAALMVAVSVIIGVDIMIGSFRQTVVNWLNTTLTADIYVTTPSRSVNRNEGFDPSVGVEISSFPGIQKTITTRTVQLETPKYGLINLVAISKNTSINRRFVWTEGNATNIWVRVKQGAVLISEAFAYRNRIPAVPGTNIELSTDRGPRLFEVAGIYYDYASERGTVLMSDLVYRNFWNDHQISSVAIYVAPSQNVDVIIQRLQSSFAEHYNLIVQSNRGLRLSALNIFDRTFTITTALRLLVGIVAFISIFNALMALQLERVHEVGVLRATGMTIAQVWRMILLETGLMGLTAGLIALPIGTLLALVLVYVINLRSFGWTLEFLLRPEHFLEALVLAVAAALLAGIYPALRFGRIQVAAAICTE